MILKYVITMQKEKIFILGVLFFIVLNIGFGFDQNGNECICYNATDCNNAIASSSCSVIKLGKDIDGQIVFNNVSNKVLDGQGHNITYLTNDPVIKFYGNVNNITLKNFHLTGNYGILFSYGKINKNIVINNFTIKLLSNKEYVSGIGIPGSLNYNIKISNFKIILNKSRTAGILIGDLRRISDNENIIIVNGTILDIPGVDIWIHSKKGNNITIKNSVFYGYNGIILIGNNKNIVIEKNDFNSTYQCVEVNGMYVNITNNLLFSDKAKYVSVSNSDLRYVKVFRNYYGKVDRTGYSDKCEDFDLDGICDKPYVLSDNITDFEPLKLWPYRSYDNMYNLTKKCLDELITCLKMVNYSTYDNEVNNCFYKTEECISKKVYLPYKEIFKNLVLNKCNYSINKSNKIEHLLYSYCVKALNMINKKDNKENERVEQNNQKEPLLFYASLVFIVIFILSIFVIKIKNKK